MGDARELQVPDHNTVRQSASIASFAWIAVALTPALMTLSSWNHGSTISPFEAFIRGYSLPVVGVELVVVAIALALGFRPFQTFRAFPILALIALLTLVVIAYATALFVAPNKSAALLRTNFWLVHLFFAMSVAFLCSRTDTAPLRFIWIGIVFGGVIHLILFSIFVIGIEDPEHFSWTIWLPGAGNIRQIVYFAVVGSCAALYFAIQSRTTRSYLLFVLAAALSFGFIFWSGSRGALLAVLLGFAVSTAFCSAARSVRAFRTLAVATLAGACLSLLHVPPDPSFGIIRMFSYTRASTLNEVGSGRIKIWRGTIREIEKRPLFGYGESQFRQIVPEGRGLNQPHNAILQFLFQWGVFGTICFGYLAAMAWSRLVRTARQDASVVTPALLIINSFLLLSLTDGALYHPYPLMMMALGLGMALSSDTLTGALKPGRGADR